MPSGCSVQRGCDMVPGGVSLLFCPCPSSSTCPSRTWDHRDSDITQTSSCLRDRPWAATSWGRVSLGSGLGWALSPSLGVYLSFLCFCTGLACFHVRGGVLVSFSFERLLSEGGRR